MAAAWPAVAVTAVSVVTGDDCYADWRFCYSHHYHHRCDHHDRHRARLTTTKGEYRVPRIRANGIDMNYELTGPADAPVVTLSSSLATSLGMWQAQARALSDAGYRVLRYDTRGHGATDVPPGPYSLDLLAEDVRALLLALRIERTHFVGISMGGMIGQTLALHHPALLAGLVLCDTAAAMPPETGPIWDERIATARSGGMTVLVEATIGRWFTPGFITARPDAVDPTLGATSRNDAPTSWPSFRRWSCPGPPASGARTGFCSTR